MNDRPGSGTDGDVILELSLEDGSTCKTDPLNSWSDDWEVNVNQVQLNVHISLNEVYINKT